jgi:hypothetical protein
MTTSTTGFGPDEFKKLIDALNKAVEDGTSQAAHMLWSALLSFLAAHALAVMIILFVVLVVAMLKAMMGRWGTLGSVIYNFLYFGILFVIGLIWGPDVFVSDFFHAACTLMLYPVCYAITGYILDKIGVRN